MRYIQSEHLKHKGLRVKLLWIAPLFTILLALVLSFSNFQNGAYNWWYIIILPALLTVVVSFSSASEKRQSRHGLFSIVVDKNRLWWAQIALYALYLLKTIVIFLVMIHLLGFLSENRIRPTQGFLAGAVWFVSFLWQIPLWMWTTEKVGAYLTFFISLFCNIGLSIAFSTTDQWWIPFAIQARLMCPILGIQPNGLWIEAGSHLLNSDVISLGLAVNGILFVVLLTVTSLWFRKAEV